MSYSKKTCIVISAKGSEDAPLWEMKNLLKSLNYQVSEVMNINLKKSSSSFFVGKGNLALIKEKIVSQQVSFVVFNNNLSPLQIHNLHEYLQVEIFDRAMIILQIFKEHASSKESKLQVEIAYLSYMASRLIQKDENYDQLTSSGGSVTNRGSGEKIINLKKYQLRKEIDKKKKMLDEINQLKQKNRINKELNYPLVTLIGYTNVGKSTLMNRLIDQTLTNKKEHVLEEDKLFATLTCSTRLIKTKGHYPFLLSDTIGFMSALPTTLINSFYSTLDEIKYADVLVFVVDISSPDILHEMNVTFSLLDQMHIDDKPLIFLYNKVDKYQNEFLPFVKENELIVSLKDDSSLNDIMHLIDKTLSFYYVDVDLFIPYEHSDDYYQILNEECVINTCEIESGYKVSCKIAKKRYKNYARYLRLSTD